MCVGFLHKSQTKQTAAVLLMRKKEGIGNRGTFYKMCVTLRSCTVIKNKEGLRKCPSQEEPEEMGRVNGIWFSGWDPGMEKGHWGKLWASE